MDEKQKYHYYHHHSYLPPALSHQLLQSKRWGDEIYNGREKSREEEPQKLSHTLIHAHSLLDW